jgi:excisionase family DNA binding protein
MKATKDIRLLGIGEAAKYLDISPRTLRDWIEEKIIGPIRIRRRLYFTTRLLEDFVATREAKAQGRTREVRKGRQIPGPSEASRNGNLLFQKTHYVGNRRADAAGSVPSDKGRGGSAAQNPSNLFSVPNSYEQPGGGTGKK